MHYIKPCLFIHVFIICFSLVFDQCLLCTQRRREGEGAGRLLLSQTKMWGSEACLSNLACMYLNAGCSTRPPFISICEENALYESMFIHSCVYCLFFSCCRSTPFMYSARECQKCCHQAVHWLARDWERVWP